MQLHIVHPVEQKLQMQKDSEGFFSVTAEKVQPGSLYFFVPDGKAGLSRSGILTTSPKMYLDLRR